MKNLILLSVTLLLTLVSNAQIVNIPDANFKAALVGNSLINTNVDDQIQVSEASSYAGGIYVGEMNISDLTGIEAFTALDSLDCHDNQLTTLDVSNNTALSVLRCWENQLTTLDVSNNTALTVLNCSRNQLTSLDVSNNLALLFFDCYTNQLSTLDISNNSALFDLSCTGNQLTSIDVSNNIALTYLWCSNNQLAALDISNNSALRDLNCLGNQLTTLDVNNNTALEYFACGGNQLTLIDVSNNTALESFSCNGNLLTLIDISNNSALENFNCYDNLLTVLDVSNNTALTYLICGDNPLTFLDVSNHTALTWLSCSNIQLTTIDVSNNPALETLSCSNIQLTTIDVSNNPALRDLNCSRNQLTTIDVSNNPALESFFCYDNLLTLLDVSNNTALTYLHCSNNQLTTLDVSNNTALIGLACSNNQLTSLDVRNGNNTFVTNDWFSATNNPNLFCIEVDDPPWSLANWTNIDTQTTFAYNCLYDIDYPNSITGKVVIDDNCILDGIEQGLQGIIVRTEPVNYYGITDNLGDYTISTDTGSYQVVQLISDINGLIVNPLCPSPNYHTISFDTLAQDTTGINFYNDVIACPYLTIDLNSNRRRRCFQNHTYINYCNEGFADASGVAVLVKFPEYVNLLSANYSYTIDSDGNYVFDIGDLAQGDCGNIHIIDSVSCELGITGLTQCTEAWITPANDCVEALDTTYAEWDASSVMVEGVCVGDTIISFTITNTGEYGEGDMQLTSEYRIYADNELVYTGTFQLNGQEELVIDVPANGQTIRLEADQHPMHPGNSHPQETIEACGDGEEPISMGFVNSVPMDDEDADIEIDCMEIRDSYDPNDKSVSPQGITANNFLMPGIALDYVIRFQNTGTDTAYTVIVVDTLSNNLDISTIQWGVSSHPYTLGLSGQGQAVLRFNFYNINLPDSTTDEANSHGFVKFKITPYDTLINGSVVENTADIYFDYNLPIRTNTTHVIISDTVIMGEPIVIHSINDFNSNNFEVKIFPNPTKGKFSILAEDVVSVEILNLQGKLIYISKETEIDLSSVPDGVYFIRVATNKQITTVKLIKN